MEMTMIMKLQRLSSPTILIRETQKHNDDNEEEEEEEEGDVEEYQVEGWPGPMVVMRMMKILHRLSSSSILIKETPTEGRCAAE